MERAWQLEIRFPVERESVLWEEMNRRAAFPWSPQSHDALGRTPAHDCLHFHFARQPDSDLPSSTFCIRRKGHDLWLVEAIIADEHEAHQIPDDQYKRLMHRFDEEVAQVAAEAADGMTSLVGGQYRLEDHFSLRARNLLRSFRMSPNRGTHLYDRDRWMDFLLQAYDDAKVKNESPASGDVFGWCLETEGGWIADDVRLRREYDFAMTLLKHAGR